MPFPLRAQPASEMLVLAGNPPGQVAEQEHPRSPPPERRLRLGGRAETSHADHGHPALAAPAHDEARPPTDRDDRLRPGPRP